MKKILLVTLTMALLTACASLDKMMEKGDYEGIVERATKKLAGNKKKESFVIALEDGWKKLVREQMSTIHNLKTANKAYDWERVISMAQNLNRMQNLIKPLLPLVAENGYRAKFDFVNTSPIIADARKNAADLYYVQLEKWIPLANEGDKLAAREAVQLIDRVNNLSDEFDLLTVRNEMVDIGTNRIWVEIEDRSYGRMPWSIREEINYIEVANYRNDWNQFYTKYNEQVNPDFKVVFRINDIYAEPEQIRRVENNYLKEIQDGWEYVLDYKGNVAKDTSGNDIKKNRVRKIKATVTETFVTKRAFLNGYMEVINQKTGAIIQSRRMNFDDCFTFTARNYIGDERALDHNQRNRIPMIACPGDLELMMNVIIKAKRSFLYEIRNSVYL